jgi:hypothetical protein
MIDLTEEESRDGVEEDPKESFEDLFGQAAKKMPHYKDVLHLSRCILDPNGLVEVTPESRLEQSLVDACIEGNTQNVEELLTKSKVDPNRPIDWKNWFLPIHYAAARGADGCFKKLRDHGADIRTCSTMGSRNFFHYAAIHRRNPFYGRLDIDVFDLPKTIRMHKDYTRNTPEMLLTNKSKSTTQS